MFHARGGLAAGAEGAPQRTGHGQLHPWEARCCQCGLVLRGCRSVAFLCSLGISGFSWFFWPVPYASLCFCSMVEPRRIYTPRLHVGTAVLVLPGSGPGESAECRATGIPRCAWGPRLELASGLGALELRGGSRGQRAVRGGRPGVGPSSVISPRWRWTPGPAPQAQPGCPSRALPNTCFCWLSQFSCCVSGVPQAATGLCPLLRNE